MLIDKQLQNRLERTRTHLTDAERILREKGAPIDRTAAGCLHHAIAELTSLVEDLAKAGHPHAITDPTQEKPF